MQRLGTGQITNQPDFWSSLATGDIFSDIEKVVASAYRWTDMDPSSPEAANRCMELLYPAGMTETRKRQGTQCGECGTPLVLLEEEAKKNGGSLDTCPNCGRNFNPPPVVGQAGTLSCPRCKTILFDDDRICNGCGALIDYSLPMGTIETETIVEPVFTENYYGYTSYGWLYPYDPYYDLAIYGCLAYAFW